MVSFLLPMIYLAFISLGLPDSLLGSAWPTMQQEFGVPISYGGFASMVIAAGTIVSSLQSDRLTRKLGTGKITVISVALTALALLGFSMSRSFVPLCLWAIPYGLGAGSIDAALNNYVAVHYESRHMSWLHCMWGVGASIGPYVMSFALTNGQGWNAGYRLIALAQIGLTALLVMSLPLWNTKSTQQGQEACSHPGRVLSLGEIIRIKGAKEIMIAFFSYCALEQTTMLWGSSFLVLHHGVAAEEAARFAALFFLGITAGRMASGFITAFFDDGKMVRLGQVVILLGLGALMAPLGVTLAKIGLVLIGLGCAPIYPSIIHATPSRFGVAQSQAIIGVEMASAYVGTCIMPPIFGLFAGWISIALFPWFLLLLLALMLWMHESLLVKTA